MFFWNSLGFSFFFFPWFFYDPMDVGNWISGSSAFSKSGLNIWKFSFHVLLKPSLENFEHYFASLWDECNCAVVWAFSGIAFLWDWNENWPFPVQWPLLSFQICWHIESSSFAQHLLYSVKNSFIYVFSPLLSPNHTLSPCSHSDQFAFLYSALPSTV